MTRHPGADARAIRLALDGLTPIDCAASDKIREWATPAESCTDLGGWYGPCPFTETHWVDDVGRTVLSEWTWPGDIGLRDHRYDCEHYGRAES